MAKSLPTCSGLPAFIPLSCSKSNRRLAQPPPPSIEQHVSCSSHPGPELITTATLKPLHPSSTGNGHVCYPLFLHSWISVWYFKAFLSWASSQQYSHGTVRLMKRILRSFSDHRTVSGQRVVWTTSGNCSFIPTSTLISQELAACSKLVFAVALSRQACLHP